MKNWSILGPSPSSNFVEKLIHKYIRSNVCPTAVSQQIKQKGRHQLINALMIFGYWHLFVLVSSARLSWLHSAFESTLNSSIISYHTVTQYTSRHPETLQRSSHVIHTSRLNSPENNISYVQLETVFRLWMSESFPIPTPLMTPLSNPRIQRLSHGILVHLRTPDKNNQNCTFIRFFSNITIFYIRLTLLPLLYHHQHFANRCFIQSV